MTEDIWVIRGLVTSEIWSLWIDISYQRIIFRESRVTYAHLEKDGVGETNAGVRTSPQIGNPMIHRDT